jgi:hypothetical protein
MCTVSVFRVIDFCSNYLLQFKIARQFINPTLIISLIISENEMKTTFDNGSLGSRNDEERSEMRYVM